MSARPVGSGNDPNGDYYSLYMKTVQAEGVYTGIFRQEAVATFLAIMEDAAMRSFGEIYQHICANVDSANQVGTYVLKAIDLIKGWNSSMQDDEYRRLMEDHPGVEHLYNVACVIYVKEIHQHIKTADKLSIRIRIPPLKNYLHSFLKRLAQDPYVRSLGYFDAKRPLERKVVHMDAMRFAFEECVRKNVEIKATDDSTTTSTSSTPMPSESPYSRPAAAKQVAKLPSLLEEEDAEDNIRPEDSVSNAPSPALFAPTKRSVAPQLAATAPPTPAIRPTPVATPSQQPKTPTSQGLSFPSPFTPGGNKQQTMGALAPAANSNPLPLAPEREPQPKPAQPPVKDIKLNPIRLGRVPKQTEDSSPVPVEPNPFAPNERSIDAAANQDSLSFLPTPTLAPSPNKGTEKSDPDPPTPAPAAPPSGPQEAFPDPFDDFSFLPPTPKQNPTPTNPHLPQGNQFAQQPPRAELKTGVPNEGMHGADQQRAPNPSVVRDRFNEGFSQFDGIPEPQSTPSQEVKVMTLKKPTMAPSTQKNGRAREANPGLPMFDDDGMSVDGYSQNAFPQAPAHRGYPPMQPHARARRPPIQYNAMDPWETNSSGGSMMSENELDFYD